MAFLKGSQLTEGVINVDTLPKGKTHLYILTSQTMAEQYCSQMLDSFLKLVHHSRSSIPTFCVSHFTFSLVATLGNLLVIRALIKA